MAPDSSRRSDEPEPRFGVNRRTEPAYGLSGSALSKHFRMLVGPDRYFYAGRRYLYASLRLLRGREGTTRSFGFGRAATRRRSGGPSQPGPYSDHFSESRRPAGRRRRPLGRNNS